MQAAAEMLSGASSTDSDDNDIRVDVNSARTAIAKRTKKELTKMRQQATRAGLHTITSGMAQDTMYLLMNILSQALLCGQLYINVQTLFPGIFGGEGCNHDGTMQVAMIWIYIQFAISAAITLFQTFLWVWQFKVSVCYSWTYHTCPVSKLASLMQQKDVRRTYARLQAERDPEQADLDEMSDTERDLKIKEYEPEDNMDPDFIVFKKFCKEIGSINSLQITCTNARSFLGAVGAIVEPLLSAYSTSLATNATLGSLAATSEADASASAARFSEEMANFQKCVAGRQVSTSMGAFIAAMGVRQAQMKKSYARLVILNQIVEEDVDRANRTNKPRRVTDAAIEAEVQNIMGDTGKQFMSYLSGKEAPEED